MFVRVGQAYEVLRDLKGARRVRHPPEALESPRATARAPCSASGGSVLAGGFAASRPLRCLTWKTSVPGFAAALARLKHGSRRRSTGT